MKISENRVLYRRLLGEAVWERTSRVHEVNINSVVIHPLSLGQDYTCLINFGTQRRTM